MGLTSLPGSMSARPRARTSVSSATRLAIAPSPRSIPASHPPRRRVAARAGKEEGGKGPAAREPWDIGRFVGTVAFFNQGVLQKTLQGAVDTLARSVLRAGSPGAGAGALGAGSPQAVPLTASAGGTGGAQAMVDVPVAGVVAVTGVTGPVGRKVVSTLLAAGKRVRALVTSPSAKDKAQSLLAGLPAAPGGALELVAVDLQGGRAGLPAASLDGVRAVISCPGDEGEGSVGAAGINALVQALGTRLGLAQGFDLLKADGSGPVPWGALDDVVMGGVSMSKIGPEQGMGEDGGPAMVFRGNVSTSNSGGFASVRCVNFDPPVDLSAFDGIELRVKGGPVRLRYKLIVRADSNWDGIAYCYSFDVEPQAWQTIRVPFSAGLFPVFRARRLRDGKMLDPSTVCSVQLMLSKFEYDGELNPHFQAGPFELPITRLAAYAAAQPAPRFVLVSAAGVTRPGRPGLDLEQEPPEVRQGGPRLQAQLAAEDALRASGLPYAVVRPCPVEAEGGRAAQLVLDQGDTLQGAVSGEDVAELCCALLSQPAALGTTFEVKGSQGGASPAAGAPRDWQQLLQGAKLVPGVTGKTIEGRYSGRTPEGAFSAQLQPSAAGRS